MRSLACLLCLEVSSSMMYGTPLRGQEPKLVNLQILSKLYIMGISKISCISTTCYAKA